LAQSHNQLGVLCLVRANYKESLRHFQKAIILNTIDFTDSCVFSNPELSQILDYRLLGISLYYKAILLYKESLISSTEDFEYLSASQKTFEQLFNFFEYIYINQLNQSNFEYYISFNREVIDAALDILHSSHDTEYNDYFSLIGHGKSIFLYQLFIESKAKEFADIPEGLIIEEIGIRNDISQCNRNIQIALNKNLDISDSENFASLVLERNKRFEDLDSLINLFEDKYPKYFLLKYNFNSVPLSLIQNKLGRGEAIIEYHFSDSILYTIIISNNSFSIYHQQIDSIVKIINQHIRGISFYDNQAIETTGEYLYHRLISPVNNLLGDINKIIFIPDSELSLFPFETLIRPNSEITDYPNYLIIDFDICYHFSSSLWYKNQINRTDDKNGISLLACAPVYFVDSSNISTNKNESLSTLPYSMDEILTIENLNEDYMFHQQIKDCVQFFAKTHLFYLYRRYRRLYLIVQAVLCRIYCELQDV